MDSWIGKPGIDLRGISSVKSTEKIYTPGKVIFLNKKEEVWGAELMPNFVFDEIITADHMFGDHFPDQVFRHVQSATDNLRASSTVNVEQSPDSPKKESENFPAKIGAEKPPGNFNENANN